MQSYKHIVAHIIALTSALVLTCGLISCNVDKKLSDAPDLTGMLVHEPVFIRHGGSTIALSELKTSDVLNLDDQMKLTAVMDNGRGLSSLTVDSNCQADNQMIGTDSVTLPYSSSYSLAQFFTVKTLLNEVSPSATELTCSMQFTVAAANGSTHEFSLRDVHVKTEDAKNSSVQILDEGLVASSYDGFVRMDFNQLGRYRIVVNGVDYHHAVLACEMNEAPVDKTVIDNPLYGLRFEPRADRIATSSTQLERSEQYCRVLVYRSDSTVVAASNLILMTMAKPQFAVRRVASPLPNPSQSHNIFDYSWRDYAIENDGSQPLFFAIPPAGTSTVDYENAYAQHPTDNPYLWARVKLPTQIAVQAEAVSNNGYQVFLVNPGQSVDVRLGVMPHDFICDQWRVPMEYTVAINANEIPIYQILNPQDPINSSNILHTETLEKRFVMTVTEDTFGSNEAYGNNCGRVMSLDSTGKTHLLWGHCGLPFSQEPAPQPTTPQTRDDGMCKQVD